MVKRCKKNKNNCCQCIENTVTDQVLPVNTYPMLQRLSKLLGECNCNCLSDFKEGGDPRIDEVFRHQVRKLIWLLAQQFYGQLSIIDFSQEYKEIYDKEKELSKGWSEDQYTLYYCEVCEYGK